MIVLSKAPTRTRQFLGLWLKFRATVHLHVCKATCPRSLIAVSLYLCSVEGNVYRLLRNVACQRRDRERNGKEETNNHASVVIEWRMSTCFETTKTWYPAVPRARITCIDGWIISKADSILHSSYYTCLFRFPLPSHQFRSFPVPIDSLHILNVCTGTCNQRNQ